MNKTADRNSLLASRAQRFVPKKQGGPGAATLGKKIMNKEAYLKEIYDSAVKDELNKLAEDERKPSRLKSALKEGTLSGLTAGATLPLAMLLADTVVPRGLPRTGRQILKDFGKDAIVGSIIGGTAGATRGAMYPSGKPYKLTVVKKEK